MNAMSYQGKWAFAQHKLIYIIGKLQTHMGHWLMKVELNSFISRHHVV